MSRTFHQDKEGTLTSSRRDGKTFLTLSPSENLSRTLVKPFMNEIFSSRLFAAKLDLSRKLRVDIGSDEKNECEGSEDEVSRFVGCRVIKAFSIARRKSDSACHEDQIAYTLPCKSLSSPLIPVRGRPAASRRPPKLPCVLNGGSPLQWTAKMRQPNEYRSESVFKVSSNAYSGAARFIVTSPNKSCKAYKKCIPI